MIKELENFGFTEKEARIYVILTSERELSAPKIASLLNIDRRTVYDAINFLFHKGYISRKKVQGREIFSALHPDYIVKDFSDRIENFKKIIPVLLKPKETENLYQEINILYGLKAINLLITRAIKSKSEVFLMGRGGYLLEQLGKSKSQFIPKLNSLNWKMIQTNDYRKVHKKRDFIPKEIRYLPENIKLDIAYIVFDNNLYFFTKKKEIQLVEIIDKGFAQTFKTYFNLLWNIAKN
ncbi:hypothetical protein COU54_02245 [Candidatus Pacearchaeota archaeon CG10_big_fil_rev_8_21_14_0_10_31_24]|nr:MAG: hypothetical protein COU54_02245 [Candidatus Pacearchaeota archaeon CG10_big_fil_rev_8_21_14_0_10_31_24]